MAFPSSGVVSYWSMEGNSNDEKGVNNGTDTSITYSSGDGKVSQGALLNATSDKINCGSTGIPSGTSSRTIACWVRRSGANPVIAFQYGSGAGAGRMFSLYVSPTDLNMYGIAADVTKSATFTASTWYHVAVTYNGTTVELFKDGSSLGTGTPTLNTDSATTFTIGHDNGTWAGGGSVGNIDELGVWDRVLSGTEISDLYNGGTGIAYSAGGGGGSTRKGLALLGVGQ